MVAVASSTTAHCKKTHSFLDIDTPQVLIFFAFHFPILSMNTVYCCIGRVDRILFAATGPHSYDRKLQLSCASQCFLRPPRAFFTALRSCIPATYLRAPYSPGLPSGPSWSRCSARCGRQSCCLPSAPFLLLESRRSNTYGWSR